MTGVVLGETVPLSLQLPDGDTGQFPQAEVYDEAGVQLNSGNPIDLTHRAEGLYTPGSAYSMENEDVIHVVYITYSNVGHSTENLKYGRANETYQLVADLDDILTDTNQIQGKLPTNDMMGSSDKSDKDDEIDAIKAVTDALPDSGALSTIQADLDDLQTRIPAALVGGAMDSDVSNMQTGVVDADALATDAVDEIVDAVWDEVLTGATHNTTNSSGKILRQLKEVKGVIAEGTAQGGAATTITLDASDSQPDDFYIDSLIGITTGTGLLQSRMITAFDNATKIATVHRAWEVNPDATSEYVIGVTNASRMADSQVDDIVDKNWDEAIAGHLGAGSTGEKLNDADAVANAATIADAVLNELISDHEGTSGSLADYMNRIKQSLLNRMKIDNAAKTLIIYADDATTPLFTFDLKDPANVEASAPAGSISERTPV